MPSTDASTRVTGLTVHENPSDFSVCVTPNPQLRLKPVFHPLECPSFPTKIWGTVTDMEKILLRFCNQYISRKSDGSDPNNFKQFWCSGEKTGSGLNYPPPLQ